MPMKWFPKTPPPESTPEVVQQCRKVSRLGYCFALLAAIGALAAIAFTVRDNQGGFLYVFIPLVFVWFAEAASRTACLHERIIELTKRIDELTAEDTRNEGQ